MRVRSGDAVVITGEVRWTWHSVLTIGCGTYTKWLKERAEGRRRWMGEKKINLNMRQMWDPL